MRRINLLFWFVVLGFLAAASLNAQTHPWPIKRFEVVMVEPSGQSEIRLFERIARLARNDVFDVDGAVWGRVSAEPLDIELMKEIEQVLAGAAEYYEAAGFRPPLIEPVVDIADGTRAFRVYLVEGLGVAAGRYHSRPCDVSIRGERVILLDFDKISYSRSFLTRHGRATIAHELFHAIQHGSPYFQNCGGNRIGAWITEGMARFAGYATLDHLPSTETLLETDAGFRNRYWSLRDYSKPLVVPHEPSRHPQSDRAYATGSFWSFLAEIAATRGRPGVPGRNPYDLSILARMLEAEPGRRDCNGAGAQCIDEVAWLDRELRRHAGMDLREAFTRFVGSFAMWGEHRAEEWFLYDRDWLDAAFSGPDGCQRVLLSPGRDYSQAQARVRAFPPLSAMCWEIWLEGFYDGVDVAVMVEMETAASQPQMDSLNGIRVKRGYRPDWDKGEVEGAPTGHQTVRFEYAFENVGNDGQGTIFLLTNVRDSAEYTPGYSSDNGTGLEVTFLPLEEFVEFGEANFDPSDITDTINSPLELRMDSAQAVLARPKKWPIEGIENPCYLSIRAHAAREPGAGSGTFFQVHLLTSGPITPGRYELVETELSSRRALGVKLPVGAASAAATVPDMPEGKYDVGFDSGFVQIDSVDADLIRGSLYGVALHLEWSENGYIPSANRTLAAHFSQRVRSSGPWPCLARE